MTPVAKGEAHHAAKLTDAQVAALRRLSASDAYQWPHRRLAAVLGVSAAHVSRILAGRYR